MKEIEFALQALHQLLNKYPVQTHMEGIHRIESRPPDRDSTQDLMVRLALLATSDNLHFVALARQEAGQIPNMVAYPFARRKRN
jgi:hypothetical protein